MRYVRDLEGWERQSLSLALKVGHITEEGGGWVHGTVTPHSLSLRGGN